MNNAHDIAIKMGANQPNDIEELCSIADVNAGIIKILARHLEGFKNLEGVIKTNLNCIKVRKLVYLFYNRMIQS